MEINSYFLNIFSLKKPLLALISELWTIINLGNVEWQGIETKTVNSDDITATNSVTAPTITSDSIETGGVRTSKIQGRNPGDPIILNGDVIITN